MGIEDAQTLPSLMAPVTFAAPQLHQLGKARMLVPLPALRVGAQLMLLTKVPDPAERASSPYDACCLFASNTTCRFLSEAGLLDLPDSLQALGPSLRKLWLSQNALRGLPDSLATLHQLRVLIASGNIFKELPPVRLGRRGCQ